MGVAPINPRQRRTPPAEPVYDEWGDEVVVDDDEDDEELEEEFASPAEESADDDEDRAEYAADETDYEPTDGDDDGLSAPIEEEQPVAAVAAPNAPAEPPPADEDEAREAVEQGATILDSLRAALRANHSRVLDLFRSWDKDGDGKVCVTPLFVSAPSLPFDPATFHAPPLAPPYVDRLAKRSCNAP